MNDTRWWANDLYASQVYLIDGTLPVEVRVGVEYLYISGLDMNEVRLPKDRESLESVRKLIDLLLKEKS